MALNIYTILKQIGFEEQVKLSPRMMLHIQNGGDLSQKMYSIIQPFYEKVLDHQQDQYKELKRLQKEIDEANKWISNQQPDSEWSLLWEHNTKTIESNQSKIKKLIEEL